MFPILPTLIVFAGPVAAAGVLTGRNRRASDAHEGMHVDSSGGCTQVRSR